MILQNKVVIVTGVGPGMGSKLAIEASRAGAEVVLVARRLELLERLASEIGESGGEALVEQADVSRPDDCKKVAKRTVERFGRIDGLVNSAYGMATMTPFEEADFDDWRRTMDVTLFGSLNMVRAVLPSMKENGRGSIVNVGTLETRKPLLNNGAYNIPKAALQAATRQLAAELGKYNIRVNSAVPGWMWGKPVQDYFSSNASETGTDVDVLVAQTASQIALGRIPPDDECAKSVLVLLSDYCTQITGAALDINGGHFFSL